MKYEKKVFKYLKEHGFSELDAIAVGTGVHVDDVVLILEEHMHSGMIVHSNDGKYNVTVILDPPIDDVKKDHHHYSWEEIQKRKNGLQGGGAAIPPAPQPGQERYDSPFLKYLPWFSQGDRGTCCGHAGALWMQANYLALTSDFPTDEEMKGFVEDVLLPIWNNLCSIRYDKWYKTVFSPQWIYYISRIWGGITAPAGSYCSAVAGAMVKYGACLWQECLTDKGCMCTPQLYSEKTPCSDTDWAKWQPFFEPLAAKHKLKGYATVRTFDGMMDAIEQSKGRGVLAPTNLELDYLDCDENGVWKTHFGSEKAGSHALWWGRVDRVNRLIGCVNTWRGQFVKYTWIDENFYTENVGEAFAAIDDEEVLIGQELYTKVYISSNVPCAFTVDGVTHTENPCSIALKSGVKYTVVAIPLDPSTVIDTKLEKDITPVGDANEVKFLFAAKPIPPVKPGLVDSIVALLSAILNFILGKRNP